MQHSIFVSIIAFTILNPALGVMLRSVRHQTKRTNKGYDFASLPFSGSYAYVHDTVRILSDSQLWKEEIRQV